MNLVEVLVAVAISALMFALTTVSFMPALETAKVHATKQDLSGLRSGVILFHTYTGRVPRDLEELCDAPFTANCNIVDPFENEYEYNGQTIRSAGLDRKMNTRDDLVMKL